MNRRPVTPPLFLALLAASCLGTRLPARPETAPDPRARLQARFHEHLAQSQFAHARWGILITPLSPDAAPWFETNAHVLLPPASNAKLFTAALALDRLGPEARIQTSLHARRAPSRSGTLRGDLVLYGRGDFSWAARFHDGDYTPSLDPLVQLFRQAGIRKVSGSLIADTTFFTGPPYGNNWSWDDLQFYYGAEASALTVEDNTLDLECRPGRHAGDPCQILPKPPTRFLTFLNHTTTAPTNGPRHLQLYRAPASRQVHVFGQLPLGSTPWIDAVSVPQPGLWLLTLLQERLKTQGIRLAGPLQLRAWPDPSPLAEPPQNWSELARIESPPVRDLVRRMMKPSQNQYAQLLLLQVGARTSLPPNPNPSTLRTTEAAGLDALQQFVRTAGLNPAEVRLDEGSGLSRTARLTPAALVGLLQFMHHHPAADAFRDSLPIAGVDGTLRNRLKGTPAEGNLTAKTGSLSGVYTLSGYVRTRDGTALAFSFMLNDPNRPSAADGRAELDTLATLLASYPSPP